MCAPTQRQISRPAAFCLHLRPINSASNGVNQANSAPASSATPKLNEAAFKMRFADPCARNADFQSAVSQISNLRASFVPDCPREEGDSENSPNRDFALSTPERPFAREADCDSPSP